MAILFAISLPVFAQDALFTFDDPFEVSSVKTDHSSVTREIVDGKSVLEFTTEQAKYPGVTLRPSDGKWDAGDAVGLAIELKNKSDMRADVHGRVDNPGPWQTSAHNSNRTGLAPGKTGVLKVYFAKNYGQDAKKPVDGKNISQILLFVANAKGGETIQIISVKTFAESASTASAGDSSSSDAGEAYRPGIEGFLFDFDKNNETSLLAPEGTDYELVDGKDGKALKLNIPANKGYPGLRFNAHKGAWDLTDFGGIRADVTNNGDKAIRVFLRLDNKSKKKDPWNTSHVSIKPGQTMEVATMFGKNGTAPGYPLDAKRVVCALIFTDRQKADTSITIDNVRAFGSPAPKTADVVALSGEMIDFSDFDASARTKGNGASATVSGGKLQVNFDGSQKWPGLGIMPRGKAWDLSNFASVQAEFTNTGDSKMSFGLRVDNPGANGREHCNSENVSLDPGQTKTVTVTFGKSWGNKGFDIDSSNVVQLLIVGPSKAASVAVTNVKANVKKFAQIPDWLGKRPPVEGNWVVTLDEDFNTPTLNKELWNTRMRYDGPLKGELQVYSEKNLSIKDGNLVFLCEKKTGHQYDDPNLPTRDYTTAVIQSYDKFTQKYGYFESRFKAPTARGLWPAFWLMPDRGPEAGDIWKRGDTKGQGMEIDIYEYLCEWGPGRYNVAAHWDGYGADHKSWGTSHLYHLPTEDGYHTLGCLWEPGRLVFYIDGKQMAEFKNDRVGSTPMFMILNVQTGRWATKDIDDSALPDKWLVDYVRVWQLKDRIAPGS
jgi:beta-glucanase (GH16 family)